MTLDKTTSLSGKIVETQVNSSVKSAYTSLFLNNDLSKMALKVLTELVGTSRTLIAPADPKKIEIQDSLLTKLPTEILSVIKGKLPMTALSALAQVCQSEATQFQPVYLALNIFKHTNLDLKYRTDKDIFLKLNSLSKPIREALIHNKEKGAEKLAEILSSNISTQSTKQGILIYEREFSDGMKPGGCDKITEIRGKGANRLELIHEDVTFSTTRVPKSCETRTLRKGNREFIWKGSVELYSNGEPRSCVCLTIKAGRDEYQYSGAIPMPVKFDNHGQIIQLQRHTKILLDSTQTKRKILYDYRFPGEIKLVNGRVMHKGAAIGFVDQLNKDSY